jgi:hypothetical protein
VLYGLLFVSLLKQLGETDSGTAHNCAQPENVRRLFIQKLLKVDSGDLKIVILTPLLVSENINIQQGIIENGSKMKFKGYFIGLNGGCYFESM